MLDPLMTMTLFRVLPIALTAVFVTACASAPHDEDLAAALAAMRPRATATPPATPETDDIDTPKRAEPVMVKGTDVMLSTATARAGIDIRGESVSLRFEHAPVLDVIHAVLGDLLKADYAIVTQINGEITLHTQAPVTREQVAPLLESVLQANGISMAVDVAGRYRIGSTEVVKGITVPLPWRPEALPAGAGMVVVPLQYIGATEMAEILRPVAGGDAILRVDSVRNLLLLNGTRSQLDGWLEIIRTFDVDFLKGMSVGLFPLAHTSVQEVDAALRSLIGNATLPAVRNPDGGAAPGGAGAVAAVPAGGNRAGAARGAAAAAVADGGGVIGGPLNGLIRVMPIERLNALLVITPRAHYLEQARIWIERLDRPNEGDASGQIYVYPVRNGSAQHLAELLTGLYGGSSTQSGGTTNSGVASGLSSTSRSTGSNRLGSTSGGGGSGRFGTSATNSLGTTGNTNAGGVTQVDLGENVRVVADDRNNALLIHANRRDYLRIEEALRKLDVAPAQVLIEASIVEVTLTDVLRYGLQWYFDDKLRGGWTGQGQLTSNGLALSGEGFGYAVVNPAGQIRAVLNALATKSLINVLSNPNVMVLDNHTANIQVGDQQPVRSSTTVTDGGTTVDSIQYRDTGVMLNVTPTVNAGDMVTMEVEQSTTDVGDVDAATGQRAFNQRQISSKVAVRSGETIILGGLIRDNKTRGKTGIPILHDLPFIGNLFGSTTVDTHRTELIVMLTPRVIRSSEDLRQAGDEMRQRMRSFRQLSGVAAEQIQRLRLPPEAAQPAAADEDSVAPVTVPAPVEERKAPVVEEKAETPAPEDATNAEPSATSADQ
ncbi:type II secretion system protein GspD [Betaproteobacteria bacterium]|nr:type II secretion system protein GspD [Betaproteobacteria bacterium]